MGNIESGTHAVSGEPFASEVESAFTEMGV
jgi:hypothetical protein